MPRIYGAYGYPNLKHSLKEFHKNTNDLDIKQLLETDKLIVFGDDCAPELGHDYSLMLPEQLGTITGRIFDAHTYKTILQIDQQQAKICCFEPAEFLKMCWGRYTGILNQKKNGSCTLLRDPLGLSTLFYLSLDQGVIFANSLAQLYDILESKPDLNLSYLARYIVNIEQASAETPFHGIKELLPGMSLTINPDLSCQEELLWDLDQFNRTSISNMQEFDDDLLHALQQTVTAWTTGETGVALELSGGTDSSGVLLLLNDILDKDQNVVAINYIDRKTPSSNEIEYAQEVADVCNTTLEFVDTDDISIFDPLPSNWKPARPNTFMLFNQQHRRTQELAKKYSCSVIMNGQGGDHVFLAPQPKRALCDLLLDRRLSQVKNILHELSTVYRTSWTSLIKETCLDLKGHLFGTLKPFDTEQLKKGLQAPYLEPQFVPAKKSEVSYLEKYMKNLLPGKAAHIAALAHAVEYSERDLLPGTLTTHPLLSQPVVELGLKIPTYQSFEDGYDRIHFRRAVSKLNRPKALWRNIKGETSGSMIKILAKSTEQIRDLIKKGRLAKEGIINVKWFEEEIQRVQHGQSENLWPLIHTIVVDRWLQQWNLY